MLYGAEWIRKGPVEFLHSLALPSFQCSYILKETNQFIMVPGVPITIQKVLKIVPADILFVVYCIGICRFSVYLQTL
jgi:hypothetical protein